MVSNKVHAEKRIKVHEWKVHNDKDIPKLKQNAAAASHKVTPWKSQGSSDQIDHANFQWKSVSMYMLHRYVQKCAVQKCVLKSPIWCKNQVLN